MLITRVITAIVLLVCLSFACYFLPHQHLCWILAGILMIMVYEAGVMYKFSKRELGSLLLLNLLIILAVQCLQNTSNMDYLNHWNIIMMIFRILTFCLWLVMAPIILWSQAKLSKLQLSILISLITLTSYNAFHYLFDKYGIFEIFTMLAIAWVADTAAYFVGKLLGKHKIAPAISPGKSWEGAIGAFIACGIYVITLQYYSIITYVLSPLFGVMFAIFITAVSIEGDFLESWCKRVAEVKDSGKILPGHGGVWDRIDSLVAVLAVSFMLL